MDTCPNTCPVKVVIKARDQATQSDDPYDDWAAEQRSYVFGAMSSTRTMTTAEPTAEPTTVASSGDQETRYVQDHSSLSKEPDTRSVTFDSSQNNGQKPAQDDRRPIQTGQEIGSPETRMSTDAFGIDKEIARRNAEATEDILASVEYSRDNNASATDFYTIELQRARTNTPTSTYCTDLTESKSAFKESQQEDQGTSKSAIYQKAVNLMAERCNNMTGSKRTCRSAISDQQQYGLHVPEYFYIEQNTPTPMTPLQAWRGYHGNVYFEPIKVQAARYSTPEHQELPLEKCSKPLREILKRSRRVQSSRSMPMVPVANQEYATVRPLARSMTNLSRNSTRSNGSSQAPKGYRKMAVLDKKAVFSETNENIHEDIIWIVGQESTGSLYLEPDPAKSSPVPGDRTTAARRQHHQQKQNAIRQRQASSASPWSGQRARTGFDRERIYKGSVVRKTHPARAPDRPALAVTGGRFAQQHLQSSPLLRTQTQYSHSNQRCLNSPDMFTGLDKLPPLEQLRASLKHIEPDQRASITHVITPLQRIKFEDAESMTRSKPFVRYSPELTNSTRLRNDQLTPRQQQKVM